MITGYRVTIDEVVEFFLKDLLLKKEDGSTVKVDPKEYKYLIDPVQGIISLDLKVVD